MSKKKKDDRPVGVIRVYQTPPAASGCLAMISLLLAAPTAVVALIAKRTRARVHTGGAA